MTTYDCDQKYGTPYNKRFIAFLKHMQKNDLVANDGVTDVKGDRNLSKIDCMAGAALAMMTYNGTEKVSHHKEKVVDMIHRAETLYGCSLAASYEGKRMPSGVYFIDPVLANASKIPEGRKMAEATRLMIDIAGGSSPTFLRTGISRIPISGHS